VLGHHHLLHRNDVFAQSKCGCQLYRTGLLAQRIAAVQATGFPRRAALVVADFNLGAVVEQTLLARFDLAMLGLYAGWSQNGLGIQRRRRR